MSVWVRVCIGDRVLYEGRAVRIDDRGGVKLPAFVMWRLRRETSKPLRDPRFNLQWETRADA